VVILTNASRAPQALALIMVPAPATLAPSVPTPQTQATRFVQLVPTQTSFPITLSGPTLARQMLNVRSTVALATRCQLILPFHLPVCLDRMFVTFQRKI